MYWIEQAAQKGHKEAYKYLYNLNKEIARNQELAREQEKREQQARHILELAQLRREQDFRDAWADVQARSRDEEFLRNLRKGR